MIADVVEYWIDGRKVTTFEELCRLVDARSKNEIISIQECLDHGKLYRGHRLKKVYGMPAIRGGTLLRDPCVHRLG